MLNDGLCCFNTVNAEAYEQKETSSSGSTQYPPTDHFILGACFLL